MARRLFARGEMVMIPTLGRHEQATRLPIDTHHVVFFSRIPHEGITFAGDDDYLGAGSMPVGFFVSTRRDRHDVTDHGVPREVNAQAAKTNATLRVRIERDRAQV